MYVEWTTELMWVFNSLVINTYYDWGLKWIHANHTILSRTFEQQGKFFNVAQSRLKSQLLLKCFDKLMKSCQNTKNLSFHEDMKIFKFGVFW